LYLFDIDKFLQYNILLKEIFMADRHPTHTVIGIELVRKLASEGHRIFTTALAREVAPSIGLSEGYLIEALYHLVKSGWTVRLRNGLYAISSTVPGTTPAHEFEIAMHLVSPAAISHWSAMHFHGLTDQSPREVFITTAAKAVPRRRTPGIHHGFAVGHTVYHFVQVTPERFFGIEKVWVGDARIAITDPERTLLDGLSMPQYCGDFAEAIHAFDVRSDNIDLSRIISYALKLDIAAAKRLGWVLEKQGVDSKLLEPLIKIPIRGYRVLDPTGPRKGPCNTRWMVQENLPGKVKS
jgi:predicted transcriptional regulator of viral defense system